ncbi:hypothetical protein DFR30_2697 [Thiogranum longum]|uniref:Uncharacterized protein n=1 Tax=Thiogranum longum TaxID=1537524 RepID=A0A4V6NDC6_9GAMM|nr:hypothetical protein [Thiogranum longum]TCK19386.1 hypothetical protein DFR30_2697 [Thiogranum longum]
MQKKSHLQLPRLFIICCSIALLLSGCSGIETFPTSARAGDTIALATGWKQGYTRKNISVTINSSDGAVYTYSPGDPAIRAAVNFYPDPVSWMAVGGVIGSDGGTKYGEAASYADVIEQYHTGDDPDWWQTVVFLDLPSGLSTGTAQVTITSLSGASYGPVPVNIIDAGIGQAFQFNTDPLGAGGVFPLSESHLEAMERSTHYTVAFSGTTLPAAVELELQHDADSLHGGVGRAFVANPAGDRKTINWKDDGQFLRIIVLGAGTTELVPGATESTLDRWDALKLYVTGGIQNLQINSVKGFDAQGAQITGVTAALQ